MSSAPLPSQPTPASRCRRARARGVGRPAGAARAALHCSAARLLAAGATGACGGRAVWCRARRAAQRTHCQRRTRSTADQAGRVRRGSLPGAGPGGGRGGARGAARGAGPGRQLEVLWRGGRGEASWWAAAQCWWGGPGRQLEVPWRGGRGEGQASERCAARRGCSTPPGAAAPRRAPAQLGAALTPLSCHPPSSSPRQYLDWSPSAPPRDPAFPPVNRLGDESVEARLGRVGRRRPGGRVEGGRSVGPRLRAPAARACWPPHARRLRLPAAAARRSAGWSCPARRTTPPSASSTRTRARWALAVRGRAAARTGSAGQIWPSHCAPTTPPLCPPHPQALFFSDPGARRLYKDHVRAVSRCLLQPAPRQPAGGGEGRGEEHGTRVHPLASWAPHAHAPTPPGSTDPGAAQQRDGPPVPLRPHHPRVRPDQRAALLRVRGGWCAVWGAAGRAGALPGGWGGWLAGWLGR